MQTKNFIVEFLMGMAPTFFILILPAYLAGFFLSPPYDALAMAAVLGVGAIIIRFREQIEARRAAWRAGRGSHGVSSAPR
jgi:membrane protein DedA with SNARE-associated domain